MGVIARLRGAKNAHKRLKLGLLVAGLLGLGVIGAGCDAGVLINFRNDTTETLFAQVNGAGRDRLSPDSFSDLDYPTSKFGGDDDPLTIVVADTRGCVVLRLATTLREFRRNLDSTIDISASDLPPLEARTDCDPNLAD